MTPEQQRIKIAEACGYYVETKNGKTILIFPAIGGVSWCDGEKDLNHFREYLPDYLNDLNAMAEAINTLDQNQLMEFYNNHIYDVVCNNRTSYCALDHANVCNATASQRAEAFLRTLNLWIE